MFLSYPRLPLDVARPLLQEMASSAIHELEARVAFTHSAADWHPTAPRRAGLPTLQGLRDAVLEAAKEHGFPGVQPRGGHTAFDQQLSAVLHRRMEIAPAEAASGGVWSFLSLVVLPDVAVWRFPDRHPRRMIGSELLLGSSNRHVFGRLWARAEVLGEGASSQLNEDEVVNILERPTIGGDRRFARTIAAVHWGAVNVNPLVVRTELMRDVMRRLRRLSVMVTFAALDEDQIRNLVEEAFEQSIDALRSVRRW